MAKAAPGIPNGIKIFFVKGTAIFIDGPAISLNNDHRNPPDWTILEI